MSLNISIGQGYDAHPLVAGRPMTLCGVTVAAERGPDGWSDADPLAHAVIDALLGAAGMGDIGGHFPPGAPQWRDAAGTRLLGRVGEMLHQANKKIVNLDATVLLAAPPLSPHLGVIKVSLAQALGMAPQNINLKAKSGNGLGFVGRGEGIAAEAVVLLETIR